MHPYPPGLAYTLRYGRICQKVRGSNPFGRTLYQRKCFCIEARNSPKSATFPAHRSDFSHGISRALSHRHPVQRGGDPWPTGMERGFVLTAALAIRHAGGFTAETGGPVIS
jgi:hypothetical protein